MLGRFLRSFVGRREPEADPARKALDEYFAGRYEEARELFAAALAREPANPDLASNLAQCEHLLGEFETGAARLERVLAAHPGHAAAVHNLAVLRMRLGHYEAAERTARAALEAGRNLAADTAHTERLLSTVLLAQGKYAEGWRAFESRRADRRVAQMHAARTGEPWRGDALEAGRTLLAFGEQGYGDLLQFARFVPLAAARLPGVRIVLACPPALRGLLGRLAGASEVIGPQENPAGAHVHASLLSLPLLLGLGAQDILRAAPPYLSVDEARARRFAGALGAADTALGDDRRLRIGLVWKSGEHSGAGHEDRRINAARDVPLAELARALPRGRLRYLGLQVGHGLPAAELAQAGIEDWSGELRDFDDTAALLANLDLLVSVDTATAHLGGALAAPAAVLLKFDADWRWRRGASESDWYPRIGRHFQRAPRDWSAPLAELHARLAALAQDGGPPSGRMRR